MEAVCCSDGRGVSVKKIIAIIVSYGAPEQTAACLAALERSAHRFAAVHVCENGGADAYRALLAEVVPEPVQQGTAPLAPRCVETARVARGAFPLFLHHAAENLGYAGGINLCLAAIAGEAWDAALILNPDSIVAPDAVTALIAHAATGPYGVIGCRLVLADNNRIQMYGGFWRAWIARTLNLGFGQPAEAPVDVAAIEDRMNFVCGAAMFATRDFVDRVGPLQEDYFLYMEEVDWCFRAGDFRLGYAHDAVVTHIHGVSTGASTRAGHRSPLSIYLNERNKLHFTRRFFPWRYPVVIVTSFLYNLLYLKRGGLRPFSHAVAGWLAGLRGEFGAPPPRA